MNNFSSMFSSFKNLNTAYDPSNYAPSCLCLQEASKLESVLVNKPYEVLDPNGNIIGYFWYYGNSIDLVFELSQANEENQQDAGLTLLATDEYIDIKDLLKSLDLQATIYDFRMEPIFIFSNNIGSEHLLKVDLNKTTVTMQLDNTISNKLVRGKYFIELTASHPVGYHETLFSIDTCTFEVR